MKFLVVLAVAIVVVSAKSLPEKEKDEGLPKFVENLQEEIKDIGAVFENPKALEIIEQFMNDIGDDFQRKLAKDTVKSMTVMMDSTKSIEQKFEEIAEIVQHTADLWKQLTKKYKEDHPMVAEVPKSKA